jgi:hypothetical protein
MCMTLQTRRHTQSSKEEISKNKQFDIPSNEDRNVTILGPRSPLGLLDTRSKTRTLSRFHYTYDGFEGKPLFCTEGRLLRTVSSYEGSQSSAVVQGSQLVQDRWPCPASRVTTPLGSSLMAGQSYSFNHFHVLICNLSVTLHH